MTMPTFDMPKPVKPIVWINLPMFFILCVISGLAIGTGLGAGLRGNWTGYLMFAGGIVLNISTFVFRRQTRDYEMWERVQDIIAQLNVEDLLMDKYKDGIL